MITHSQEKFDELVKGLVPSLSKSLAEEFNVFRVMHHGTHEKQLSNVFAWLLEPTGNHGLGLTFQTIFIGAVNERRASEPQLPTDSYRVLQEVNTSPEGDPVKDIADIVLTSPTANIVIENFESSDGHGHDYYRYLGYSQKAEAQGAVVLLSAFREPQRQTRGWENAISITYSELLTPLKETVAADRTWKRMHPQQDFFLTELFTHFLEGPRSLNIDDQIAFINTMCQTGESARYGQRPKEAAADEFAAQVAQHARHQFVEARDMLTRVRHALRRYVEHSVIPDLNNELLSGRIQKASLHWSGLISWSVILLREDSQPEIFLLIGPTAVRQHAVSTTQVPNPDYSKLFLSHSRWRGKQPFIQTDISLKEILEGIDSSDTRLKDAILSMVQMH